MGEKSEKKKTVLISGLFGRKPLVAFTSEESHYSIKKVDKLLFTEEKIKQQMAFFYYMCGGRKI